MRAAAQHGAEVNQRVSAHALSHARTCISRRESAAKCERATLQGRRGALFAARARARARRHHACCPLLPLSLPRWRRTHTHTNTNPRSHSPELCLSASTGLLCGARPSSPDALAALRRCWLLGAIMIGPEPAAASRMAGSCFCISSFRRSSPGELASKALGESGRGAKRERDRRPRSEERRIQHAAPQRCVSQGEQG